MLKPRRVSDDPVRRLLTDADRARDADRPEGAVAAYAEALKLAPDNAPIWVQYAHMLKQVGRAEDAVAAYLKAAAIDPLDSDAWLHLAHLYKAMRRFDDAADAFLHTLERKPDQDHAAA